MTGSERALLRMLKARGDGQLSQIVSSVIRDREQLEVVVNSLQLGVVVLNTDYKVVFINREGRRLLPLRTEGYRGRSVWSIVADEALADFLRENLLQQSHFQEEERGLEVRGRKIILRLSVGSLVRDRKWEGCIVSVADVTEEKRRLLKLRRAEQLASFTTAAAGMAHDIRNPLEAISIHLQFIDKKLRQQERAGAGDLLRYTKVIGEEVQRLDQRVQDFLSLTRQQPLPLQRLDIGPALRRVVELMAPEMRRHRIQLDCVLPERLPPIKGSEQALQDVWVNLIKNAIQAMPEGGGLSISAGFDDQRVYVSLLDSGPGVAAQHAERIFEPYYTTKPQGSGLGLTRVYQTVREHQGSIDVGNGEGGGCRVSLSFPREQADLPLIEEKSSIQGGSD